jgi:hypothetical protein
MTRVGSHALVLCRTNADQDTVKLLHELLASDAESEPITPRIKGGRRRRRENDNQKSRGKGRLTQGGKMSAVSMASDSVLVPRFVRKPSWLLINACMR